MRIVINGMFWSQPTVGSGQYLHNLVSVLARHPVEPRFVLVIPRFTCVKRPVIPGWQVILMPTPFDRLNDNLAKVWFEQVTIPQIVRKLRADLLHVPYFGAPWRSSKPVIVTVHDLIPLLLPAYRGHRGVRLYMQLAAESTRRATAVIADSEWTRRDVVQHLRVPAERVSVVHLAAAAEYGPQSPEVVDEVCARLRIERPYVFYVGGFDIRKNVEMVIRAFAGATRDWPKRPRLVIAGRLPAADRELFPDINQVILETGIAGDVALLGPVSAADNAALMSGCSAFLFPSRYEGFGLSPLEAMQCGAPVIASSTTSVGEVVADGGALADPDDLEGWTALLRRVILEPAFADDLRQRGRERAQHFSWTTTAEQTLAAYRRVVPNATTRGARGRTKA